MRLGLPDVGFQSLGVAAGEYRPPASFIGETRPGLTTAGCWGTIDQGAWRTARDHFLYLNRCFPSTFENRLILEQ
jgi:hypothetical protein